MKFGKHNDDYVSLIAESLEVDQKQVININLVGELFFIISSFHEYFRKTCSLIRGKFSSPR